jgi:hypothetical protein
VTADAEQCVLVTQPPISGHSAKKISCQATWPEVVAGSAERAEEALGVLGGCDRLRMRSRLQVGVC